jgi:hypothetical protein
MLLYYPKSDIIPENKKSGYATPPWEVGYIESGSFIGFSEFLNKYDSQKEMKMTQEKLQSCRNKDGKKFSEIYPKKEPS